MTIAREAPGAVGAPLGAGGVGLIGAGFIGGVHRAALAALAGQSAVASPTVVAVADVDRRAAQDLADRWPGRAVPTDVETMLRDPRIHTVVLCTPNAEHRPIAEAVLAAGKQVVCEKPLASSLDDAAAMSRAAAGAASRSAVSFVFRTWPVIEQARSLIKDGAIGEPFSFNGHMYHGYGLEPGRTIGWRTDAVVAGGGAVVDVGSHIIDIARYLMGEISTVAAHLHQVVPERGDPAGRREPSSVDDAAALLVGFADGAVGSVRASWAAAGYGSDLSFEILGSHGSLAFSWRCRDELRLARAGRGAETLMFDAGHTGAPNFWSVAGLGVGYQDAFISFYRKFFSPDPRALGVASFEDAFRCHAVVDAAIRSARAGAERVTPEGQVL